MKRVVFLTGTRADFGKLKSLINILNRLEEFEVHVFVTGMHMLSKYGYTYDEVIKSGYRNIHPFMNQAQGTHPDIALANTITGFSNYVTEIRPDMIVVHGDRLEALAGAIVGAFNNILVAHIEGGEVSGTIDEGIRHAITKLAHIHFVANDEAKGRLIGMGEDNANIFVIGSPDIDIMLSPNLPSLADAKKHYNIEYGDYAIISYHPVYNEQDAIKHNTDNLLSACWGSDKNFIVIYPNNDPGSDIILLGLEAFKNYPKFKIFPSIRFEYFLTLLRNAEFIIGNSSAGIREAEVYGVPAIDVGTRQNGRTRGNNVWHVSDDRDEIKNAITNIEDLHTKTINSNYGLGNSSCKFYEILKDDYVWRISTQKSWKNLGQ